jgi:UDP-N-acetylglucosamine 2-epimerase (non-hydrolysing)
LKILTVLGTRPEIIRLSRVIEKLDALCDHVVAYTGQNYDPRLSEIFFQQLRVRAPNYSLGVRGDTIGEQLGQILAGTERVMLTEKPDRLLILGDTNSALAAIMAKRLGISVYHMEAGNRCFDDRVPEEVNRRIIDHSSDILLPYTERSRQNLLREGIAGDRVYVTGNPINEVISHYKKEIDESLILAELGLQARGYLLVTLHRAENVDVRGRLEEFLRALDRAQKTYDVPVIISTHPRTQARLQALGASVENPSLRFLPPFGFFDFIALERAARCVLSDSGTVQEECAIFGVPNVTLRDVTERPETIECGSNMLAGAAADQILLGIKSVLAGTTGWVAPAEYRVANVSETVAKIVLGYRHSVRA